MCLDVGERRIGVALSDETATIAGALEVYKRTGNEAKDIEHFKQLAAEKSAAALVVGMPYSLSGEKSVQTEKVEAFVEKLKNTLDIEVYIIDERLSTAAVERVLIEADVSRKKRKKVIDAMAATFILQGFLDALKQNRP